jgi:hypothetical protein
LQVEGEYHRLPREQAYGGIYGAELLVRRWERALADCVRVLHPEPVVVQPEENPELAVLPSTQNHTSTDAAVESVAELSGGQPTADANTAEVVLSKCR